MEFYTKVHQALKSMERSLESGQPIDRGDLDQILVYLDHESSAQFERFRSVADDFDRRWGITTDEAKRETVGRLRGLLTACADIAVTDSTQETERLELAAQQRAEIREYCSRIRDAVSSSTTIPDFAKIRIIDLIGDIDIELQREEPRLGSFLVAWVQVSRALGEVGENLTPLTDRIIEVVTLGVVKRKALPPPNTAKQLPPPR